MNEFTKEELNELENGLAWIIDRGQQNSATFHAFIKLKKLISNYCEPVETDIDSKNKIYREQVLPKYDNDPDKVPPHLEPDYNEGWK